MTAAVDVCTHPAGIVANGWGWGWCPVCRETLRLANDGDRPCGCNHDWRVFGHERGCPPQTP